LRRSGVTHTLHRRGDRESLSQDYIVFTMSAKGLNEEGSAERMTKFLGILLKHKPVNYGDMVTGNCHVKSQEEILQNIQSTSIVHGVFTDEQDVVEILKELKEADWGCVVTDPRRNERAAGERLGEIRWRTRWGYSVMRNCPRTRSPAHDMCGHGMVPANLVERVITQVKRGKKTLREGAVELTRPCHCGIYNPIRAEHLLRRLLPLVTLGA
jgi:hypothetical protein